jgi:hypothetical protein
VGQRALPALLGFGLASACAACSTTYTEADVESAEYDAQGTARREGVMDEELGAMGGRNAEALGEAGEEVIIQSDR